MLCDIVNGARRAFKAGIVSRRFFVRIEFLAPANRNSGEKERFIKKQWMSAKRNEEIIVQYDLHKLGGASDGIWIRRDRTSFYLAQPWLDAFPLEAYFISRFVLGSIRTHLRPCFAGGLHPRAVNSNLSCLNMWYLMIIPYPNFDAMRPGSLRS